MNSALIQSLGTICKDVPGRRFLLVVGYLGISAMDGLPHRGPGGLESARAPTKALAVWQPTQRPRES